MLIIDMVSTCLEAGHENVYHDTHPCKKRPPCFIITPIYLCYHKGWQFAPSDAFDFVLYFDLRIESGDDPMGAARIIVVTVAVVVHITEVG